MGKLYSRPEQKAGPSASYANSASEPALQEIAAVHTAPIQSLCAAGNECLLTGGVDKDIVLYSWQHHVVAARFNGPTKDVTKVVYNNHCSTVYAASRDRVIYSWKWPETKEEEEEEAEEEEEGGGEKAVENGTTKRESTFLPSTTPKVYEEPQGTLEGHTLGVTALATSDDFPQVLCSGSRDNSVCLWDTHTNKSISSMYSPRNLVTGLEWIRTEMSVLQSSEDKSLRVWDLRSCSTVQHFRAKQYIQTCCAVSQDSTHFLGGSSGGNGQGAELTLWDRRNEKKYVREFKGHSESVQDCMFVSHMAEEAEHSKWVCSAGSDSNVILWDKQNADTLHTEYVSGAGPITSLVCPAEGMIGCSSFKGGVSIWTVLASSDSTRFTARAKY